MPLVDLVSRVRLWGVPVLVAAGGPAGTSDRNPASALPPAPRAPSVSREIPTSPVQAVDAVRAGLAGSRIAQAAPIEAGLERPSLEPASEDDAIGLYSRRLLPGATEVASEPALPAGPVTSVPYEPSAVAVGAAAGALLPAALSGPRRPPRPGHRDEPVGGETDDPIAALLRGFGRHSDDTASPASR